MEDNRGDVHGSSRNGDRRRVLVIGPIYPNGGGVGMVDSILLSSRLRDEFDMLLLDTSRPSAHQDTIATLAPINFYIFLRQALRLLGILIARRPVIVHQSVTDGIAFWKESAFMALARLFGVKAIGHLHGPWLEAQLRKAGPWRKRLMVGALHIPHVLIALSDYWCGVLQELVSSDLDVAVIPNCVDPSIAEAMNSPGQPVQKEPLVLFLGWLGSRKGVPDALQAAQRVCDQAPETTFVFGGNLEPASDREIVAQACRTAGLDRHISFPGLVTGDQKLDLLRRAAIFILPSYRENLPVSILEAMAMGLPVVATSIAGVPELVEEGHGGYLIEPGNVDALADRILRLVRDPGLRDEMGRFNVARVRQYYTPSVYAQTVGRLYRQISPSRPGGGLR